MIDVKGMSVQDILNMDGEAFNKLNESDLRKVTGRLVSAGNKRLRTFEKRGEVSPATRFISNSGGKFSTKGKNLNALRAEFTRARNFMQSQTGTIKGWKQTKNKAINEMKKRGVDVPPDKFDNFWKIYEKLKELDPNIASKTMKYTVLEQIKDMLIEHDDPAGITNRLYNRLEEIYEEQAERENADGVSEFFEL